MVWPNCIWWTFQLLIDVFKFENVKLAANFITSRFFFVIYLTAFLFTVWNGIHTTNVGTSLINFRGVPKSFLKWRPGFNDKGNVWFDQIVFQLLIHVFKFENVKLAANFITSRFFFVIYLTAFLFTVWNGIHTTNVGTSLINFRGVPKSFLKWQPGFKLKEKINFRLINEQRKWSPHKKPLGNRTFVLVLRSDDQ